MHAAYLAWVALVRNALMVTTPLIRRACFWLRVSGDVGRWHAVAGSCFSDPVAFTWLRVAHRVLAYLFFATFLAHFAAVLDHGLIRRDGVLRTWEVRESERILISKL